jgi:hypothetical protein
MESKVMSENKYMIVYDQIYKLNTLQIFKNS